MSDPAMHAPETAETPTSPVSANGHSSDGGRISSLDSSPSISDAAARALPEEMVNVLLASSSGTVAMPEGDHAPPPAAEDEDEPRPRPPSLWRSDLVLVAVLLAAIFVLSLIQLYRRYGFDAREIEVLHPAEYRFTLDINTATWVEWLQLDGVGEVLARRIIEYRERHGPFRSIDDLKNVHGIGDATLEKMRPHLRLDPPASDSP